MPSNGPSLFAFIVLAAVTLAGAIGAVTLRNLVHCGLSLAVAFAGLAALYLQLNAEFVGFAQILVYVGAVAILIVFTILLTRNTEVNIPRVSRSWVVGLVVAIIVCASLVLPILKSPSLRRSPVMTPMASVRVIGEKLMTQYVIPLEAIALVLTAALLGAVVIAMRDEPMARDAVNSAMHSQRESHEPHHPSRLTPLPVEGRGGPEVAKVSSTAVSNPNSSP